MIEQERAFKGEDAVRFLKHLMHRIPGKLLVVWDGSPIHRGRAVSRIFWRAGRLLGCDWSNYPALRTRSKPRGGDLEAPQVRGVEEPLLPEPGGVEGRAAQGQRALEAQKRCHPRLHQTARIRGLGVCAEISKAPYRAKSHNLEG
jgi:hypothetical protein